MSVQAEAKEQREWIAHIHDELFILAYRPLHFPPRFLHCQAEAKEQREWIMYIHDKFFDSRSGELRALRLADGPLDTFWAAAMVRGVGDQLGWMVSPGTHLHAKAVGHPPPQNLPSCGACADTQARAPRR